VTCVKEKVVLNGGSIRYTGKTNFQPLQIVAFDFQDVRTSA